MAAVRSFIVLPSPSPPPPSVDPRRPLLRSTPLSTTLPVSLFLQPALATCSPVALAASSPAGLDLKPPRRVSLRAVRSSSSSSAHLPSSRMKVAVVGGTGNVGSRLAQQLCLAGMDVVLASRNPTDEKTASAVAKVQDGAKGSASAASFQEAVAGADAVIIATPGYPTAEDWKPIVEPFASYEGVVLDATNPLSPWPELKLNVDQNTTSAAEELQKVLPKAKVFKAFNTLGAEIMSNPTINGQKVTMMFAGPAEDAAVKETAEKVIAAVGFEPAYVGPIRAARNLESIAELWIHMAVHYKLGERSGFAFSIQK